MQWPEQIRYRPVQELGTGASGTAYEAEPVDGGFYVLVKVSHDSWAGEMMGHEYNAMLALEQSGCPVPKAIEITDIEDESGEYEATYLVRELVPGESLSQVLKRKPEPAEAEAIFQQLRTAIECIHAAGWIHGDLGTGNIIWDRDSQKLTLIDFEMADPMDGLDEEQIEGEDSQIDFLFETLDKYR